MFIYKFYNAILVTLEDKPYANMTIPGMIQLYVVVGKPIIGSIYGNCANFIKTLKQNLTFIGKHLKSVYFDKYNKFIFIDRLVPTLEKTVCLKDNHLDTMCEFSYR